MKEVHKGSCREHRRGHCLHQLFLWFGYYWPSMFKDCLEFASQCQTCQLHASLKYLPQELFQPIATHWPFQIQGLYFISTIGLVSSKGQRFILVMSILHSGPKSSLSSDGVESVQHISSLSVGWVCLKKSLPTMEPFLGMADCRVN